MAMGLNLVTMVNGILDRWDERYQAWQKRATNLPMTAYSAQLLARMHQTTQQIRPMVREFDSFIPNFNSLRNDFDEFFVKLSKDLKLESQLIALVTHCEQTIARQHPFMTWVQDSYSPIDDETEKHEMLAAHLLFHNDGLAFAIPMYPYLVVDEYSKEWVEFLIEEAEEFLGEKNLLERARKKYGSLNLLIGGLINGEKSSYDRAIKNVKKKCAGFEKQLKQAQKQLAKIQSKEAELKRNTQLQGTVTTLTSTINKLNEKIEQYKKRIKSISKQQQEFLEQYRDNATIEENYRRDIEAQLKTHRESLERYQERKKCLDVLQRALLLCEIGVTRDNSQCSNLRQLSSALSKVVIGMAALSLEISHHTTHPLIKHQLIGELPKLFSVMQQLAASMLNFLQTQPQITAAELKLFTTVAKELLGCFKNSITAWRLQEWNQFIASDIAPFIINSYLPMFSSLDTSAHEELRSLVLDCMRNIYMQVYNECRSLQQCDDQQASLPASLVAVKSLINNFLTTTIRGHVIKSGDSYATLVRIATQMNLLLTDSSPNYASFLAFYESAMQASAVVAISNDNDSFGSHECERKRRDSEDSMSDDSSDTTSYLLQEFGSRASSPSASQEMSSGTSVMANSGEGDAASPTAVSSHQAGNVGIAANDSSQGEEVREGVAAGSVKNNDAGDSPRKTMSM